MASIHDYLPEERQRAAAHERALTEAHRAWNDILVAFQPIGQQLFSEAVENGIVPTPGKHGPFIPLRWADSDTHRTMALTSEGLLSERHSLQELVNDLAHGRASMAFSLKSRETSEPVIVVDPLYNFDLGSEPAPVGDFIARYLANLVSSHGSTPVPSELLELVALPEGVRAERIHKRCEELVSSYSPQGKRLYDEMINDGHPPIKYSDGKFYYSVDSGSGRRHELREDGRLTAGFGTGQPEKLPRSFFTFVSGDLEKLYPQDMHPRGIRDFFLSPYAVTYYRNVSAVRARQDNFRPSGGYSTEANDHTVTASPQSLSMFSKVRTWLNGQ